MSNNRLERVEVKLDKLLNIVVILENHAVRIDTMNQSISEIKVRVKELEDVVNQNKTKLLSLSNTERAVWALAVGGIVTYLKTM